AQGLDQQGQVVLQLRAGDQQVRVGRRAELGDPETDELVRVRLTELDLAQQLPGPGQLLQSTCRWRVTNLLIRHLLQGRMLDRRHSHPSFLSARAPPGRPPSIEPAPPQRTAGPDLFVSRAAGPTVDTIPSGLSSVFRCRTSSESLQSPRVSGRSLSTMAGALSGCATLGVGFAGFRRRRGFALAPPPRLLWTTSLPSDITSLCLGWFGRIRALTRICLPHHLVIRSGSQNLSPVTDCRSDSLASPRLLAATSVPLATL